MKIDHAFELVARLILIAGLVCFPAILWATPASAQTTKATVLGTVADEKGAVIPNVKITATNLGTGISREAMTDDAGRYRVAELLPGKYEVKAEREGFGPEVRSGIDLTVGRDAVVDFQLKVGVIQEKLVVQGDAPLIETTSSAIGYLVNTRQIEELPLNGRDVLQLATLQNGVVSTASITVNQGEGGAGTTRLTVNGARLDFNAYYLDGTETSDAFGLSPGGLGGGMLGVDALREFQVLTSSYSAEYGQGGGAIINAVTKSGTNEFHGTAFEFLRNSALDARNFFNAEKLPFKRNQFGGSLGGPIVKNRTFFFVSTELLRRREGTTTIFNVPSPAALAGHLTTGNVTVAASVLPYIRLYPAPNGPISGDTGIWRRDFNETTNENYFMVRLDHKLTEKHSVFGRYTFDDSDLRQAEQTSVILDEVLTNRDQYLTLEEEALISSRAVNSVRFSFNRSSSRSDFPFSVPVDPSLGFIPGHPMGAFSIPGVAELRSALTVPRNFILNTFEGNDQFLYNRGGHAFKFGGSVRRYQLNADSPLVTDGIFVYFGGLASFLTANPRAAVLFVSQPGTSFYRGIRESLFGFYAQDDWKIRRNLTLNLGLRYEPISTPTVANGEVANFRNLTDSKSVIGDPYIKNPSKKNFGPRVGFAWDPTGTGRWSIRGGFGTFYSAILPMRYRFNISSVPPFANLLVLPGIFPDSYTRTINTPIPFPGLLWLTQFNAEQPTVYQWSFNVQHELGKSFVVQVGYVGSRGVHLETNDSTNVRVDSTTVNGQKFFPPTSNTQAARANPQYGTINLTGFNADSHYHALQLNATKRYSAGLQFQLAYTFSKSIDTGSQADTTFTNGQLGADRQDPFNASMDKGPSDFDTRHNFVANFLWDLPIGKNHGLGSDLSGVAAKLVEGWSLGGILNLRSGFPFTAVLGIDRAGNGIDDVHSQRPNVLPGRSFGSAITGQPDRYVDPTTFVLQPAGFYGNEGRNTLRGPNLKVFDFSVLKKTAITEHVNMEFRFEAFNIVNHTNLVPPDDPQRVVFSDVDPRTGRGVVPASFGQLTKTATTSRQLQFGLKLIW